MGVGVAEQRPSPHRFAPAERSRDWCRRVRGRVGAIERVVPWPRDRAGRGSRASGGAGGGGLAGAASQAVVS